MLFCLTSSSSHPFYKNLGWLIKEKKQLTYSNKILFNNQWTGDLGGCCLDFVWILSGWCSIFSISVSGDPLESSDPQISILFVLFENRDICYKWRMSRKQNSKCGKSSNNKYLTRRRRPFGVMNKILPNIPIGFNFFFCGVDIFLRMINKFIFSQYVMHQPMCVH